MITLTKWFIRTGAAVAIGLTACAAPAFAFPDRPITMIVPWAPGGSTDQTARVLAKAAEKQLGQPIIILNKPGASTIIGMRELAQAKPDGYTIGTLSSTTYLAPLTGQPVTYEMLKDFTFISYYGDNLIGIAVLKDKPWKTLQDLVEDGKKNPDKLNFGTGGANRGDSLQETLALLQFAVVEPATPGVEAHHAQPRLRGNGTGPQQRSQCRGQFYSLCHGLWCNRCHDWFEGRQRHAGEFMA